MSRISKMSKSEALEYLIKVSKVQEKLLNKLGQNTDPKKMMMDIVPKLFGIYGATSKSQTLIPFSEQLIRELQNSAKFLGVTVPKPPQQTTQNSFLQALNSSTDAVKLLKSLEILQNFINNNKSTLERFGFQQKKV